jgi:tetraacyldisaccharide 4'-kinase
MSMRKPAWSIASPNGSADCSPMQAPDFWYGRAASVSATMLSPLSALFECAGRLNRWMTTSMPVPVPVICVGNLVAGGAGKTPTAIALAKMLQAQGHAVHMLTRGYGGALSGPVRVDPQYHTATDVGDEALLLARVAPTWVGADRRVIAHRAAEAGATFAIMDDGFQNPSIKKDLSLIVVDGEVGLGNGRVMPAGPLREDPSRALARADAVLIMGEDRVGVGARLRTLAGRPLPILGARLAATDAAQGLRGKRLFAFAGIARPEKFFASLRAAGCDLAGIQSFPDHYPFRKGDLAALRASAEQAGAMLVTTEKDHVRLHRDDADGIAVFAVAAVFDEPDRILALLALLATKAVHDRSPA